MPALISVILGILLGWAIGGSVRRLAGLELHLEWLLLPLFVLQALARGRALGVVGASQLSIYVWAASSTLLVFVMLLNWKTPGMALGAVGILMNLDVVLLNSAMPVVLGGSIESISIEAASIVRSTGGFYRVAGAGDLLTWIGDVIPVSQSHGLLMISPGDVVLMVAVSCIIMRSMVYEDDRNIGDATDA